MRLGSHIALEIVVGASVVAGLGAGALTLVPSLAPSLASGLWPSPPPAVVVRAGEPPAARAPETTPALPPPGVATPAVAAAPGATAPVPGAETALAMAATTATVPAPLPGAAEPPPPAGPAVVAGAKAATVYGAPDEELLAPLRGSSVTGVKLNLGGTTLSLRLDFASGGRAAFKPEQIHPGSQPRREIAAYVIDRLLGIGRVPPAAAIAVSLDEVLAAGAARVEVGTRVRAEAKAKRGVVRGAASWWIPEIKVAMIGKHPIDSTDGIVTWKRHLAIGASPPADVLPLVAAISDMVLFDFLIDNSDRWSGGNARTSPDGKILYFMDNTMSFSTRRQGHTRTATYLRRVQQFSRRLVDQVRALTRERLVAALESVDDAGLGTLLTAAELDAIMARHALAVAYLDELIAAHGEDAVLVFP